jgi:PR domain zinc finger protein 13
LKIHLATNCDKLSKEILWTRLIEQSRPIKAPTPTSTLFFSPSPPLQQYGHSHFSNPAAPPVYPSLSHHTVQPWIQQDRVSAFRPVSSVSPHSITPSSPSFISNTEHQSILQAAARLETIVSNMGTSKQGHICIYCGKFYSRKYGLKIHIRTHTGFKPLKCKYCYRPFGDPSNLNKHVRLHVQSNSIYKCTLCSKILVRRRDLQRHLQTRHSNEMMSGDSGTSKTVVHHLSSSLLSSSSSSDDDDENDGEHYLPS